MVSRRRTQDRYLPARPAVLAAALLITVACGRDLPPFARGNDAPVTVSEAPRAPRVPASVRWVPERIIEGTVMSILIEGGDPAVRTATGTFGGERLHFDRDTVHTAGALSALAAAPLDSAGTRVLTLALSYANGAEETRHVEIPVDSGAYRLERLSVAPQFGQPQPEAIRQRMAEEAARARTVSAQSHETPRMWQPPFLAPRESRITSGFGHGRTFNGQVQSRHTGTDFAGAVGAPVRAPARAVVALVDDFYLGGGVVYLDHGAGLVTAYLHLSAKDVAAGDVVDPGQVIGRVGATGRVTGPHLHWIVRYGGHSVDGMSLLNHFR